MTLGFARTYNVELLYETAPQLDLAALTEAVQRNCGRVDMPEMGDGSGVITIFHLDHMVEFTDGKVPAQTVIMSGGEGRGPDMEALEPALQQSWDWQEARLAVERSRASMLVTDMLSSGLDYKERLGLFHCALTSVVEVAPPVAIHWLPSGQIINPQSYLEERRAEQANPLYGAVNVRLFNIQDRAPGEMLMDTLGLAALGLPDLQCHFVGLDPNTVGGLLYNTSLYLYEHGDIIEDGQTLGFTPDQRWRCRHEDALVQPERVVLDVDPGLPYAAGNRE